MLDFVPLGTEFPTTPRMDVWQARPEERGLWERGEPPRRERATVRPAGIPVDDVSVGFVGSRGDLAVTGSAWDHVGVLLFRDGLQRVCRAIDCDHHGDVGVLECDAAGTRFYALRSYERSRALESTIYRRSLMMVCVRWRARQREQAAGV